MSLAVDWFRTKEGEDPMNYLADIFRYASARLGQRQDAEDIAIEGCSGPSEPPAEEKTCGIYMLGMARRKVADRLRRSRKPASK